MSSGVSGVPDTTELRRQIELWQIMLDSYVQFNPGTESATFTEELRSMLATVDKLQAENQQLRSAVEAAQRLHRQNTGRINVCVHCQGTWPCATTRALAAVVVGEPGKAGGE